MDVGEGEGTYAQHTLRPNQLDVLVGDAALCFPLGVGFEVPQIADMALGVGRGTVVFGEWINCFPTDQG